MYRMRKYQHLSSRDRAQVNSTRDCNCDSIAVETHHNNGNFYNGKHLTEVTCSFRGSLHYHHGAMWWHVGRHDTEEAAENSTSCK